MYRYKIDVLKAMSEKGFTTYRIRKDRIFSESTLAKLRNQENITLNTLNNICVILRCQLSDIVEIEITDEEKIKFF